ncbi:MAG TPA: hypothetical protein VHX65_16995 [Pirellulales bacterium]|jgi:hypothetical protein|nr:hypothetical protein [Pirellulales bacterium]
MRQRIITAAIRRCAFAISKAAADVVLAADRCAMRMFCHLFHARHGSASPASRSNIGSIKRLALLGSAFLAKAERVQPATYAYQPATTCRPANTQAWLVRPAQVVRGLAPVSLG